MTLIDGDRIITAQLYDDEHEEFTEKKMSIIEYINAYTDEGVTKADVFTPKITDRHGIPDLPTVPPMPQRAETPERPLPWKAETPEDAQRVIEQAGAAATMNINNLIEGKNIEKELAGIREELHALNSLLERWKRKL